MTNNLLKDLVAAFNHDFLSQIDAMPFPKAEAYRAGGGVRISKKRGRSMDFAGYREYTPGDDVRQIDWHSYARFNRHFLKLYADERRCDVNIFLDCSPSMTFDAQKMLSACLISASIAYKAIKNMDRVHVFLLGLEDAQNMPKHFTLDAFQNIQDLFDILGKIELSEGNKSANNHSAHHLGGITKTNTATIGRGLSFVLSDFFWDTDLKKELLYLKYLKQTVCLIHIMSIMELNPDTAIFSGYLKLLDSENNAVKPLMCNALIHARYQKEVQLFRDNLRDLCNTKDFGYVFAQPDVPLSATMRIICESFQ